MKITDITNELDKKTLINFYSAFETPIILQTFRTDINNGDIKTAKEKHKLEILNGIIYSEYLEFSPTTMNTDMLYNMSGFKERKGRMPNKKDKIKIIRGNRYFTICSDFIISDIGFEIVVNKNKTYKAMKTKLKKEIGRKENCWNILNGKYTLPDIMTILKVPQPEIKKFMEELKLSDKHDSFGYFTTMLLFARGAYIRLVKMKEIDNTKIFNFANKKYDDEGAREGDMGMMGDDDYCYIDDHWKSIFIKK